MKMGRITSGVLACTTQVMHRQVIRTGLLHKVYGGRLEADRCFHFFVCDRIMTEIAEYRQ